MIRRTAWLGSVGLLALGLVVVAGCGTKSTAPDGKSAAQAPAGSGAKDAPEADADTTAKDAPAAGEETDAQAAKAAPRSNKMVPLDIKLPKPAFVGTPKNVPPGTTVEKPTGKARPPFMAPEGCKNVALGKPIGASDEEPIIGEIDYVTNGDKEAADGSYVELGPGKQHVQIDLEGKYEIYAIVVWHFHSDPRVYRDVVVQLANDADFIMDVKTVFNNDHDSSSGLGIGKDYEFFEVAEGKLIDTKGAVARYVRLYSNGSTADDMNHYTEVEVYGRPAE